MNEIRLVEFYYLVSMKDKGKGDLGGGNIPRTTIDYCSPFTIFFLAKLGKKEGKK